MTVQSIRHRLIRQIEKIEDKALLEALSVLVDHRLGHDPDEVFKEIAKPLTKTLDVEKLAEEQGYKGFDRKEVDAMIDDLAIEESLEELIASI
jgi:Glu-tRNA(Gln) amidotransferase subunit E-like FAD-binding protein